MKHYLIAVDLQKDFVDGALGTPQAMAMIPHAAEKIRGFQGKIFVTLDTHFDNYLASAEGKMLPVPHCVRGSSGWMLDDTIAAALEGKDVTRVEKVTFGSVNLPELLRQDAAGEDFDVELMGLCTDICVVSNALLLKAHFPEAGISVDAACCAGVTPQTHRAALDTMRCCQIQIQE